MPNSFAVASSRAYTTKYPFFWKEFYPCYNINMSDITHPIAITVGEPAGIGPELVVQLLQTSWAAPLVIIGNQALLENSAKKLNLSLGSLKPYSSQELNPVSIIDLPLGADVIPGQLDKANAPFVMKTLERAAEGALSKEFLAVVTGPVHKGILNEAGFQFSGHTEFFAEKSGVAKPVMLFLNQKLKLALVTTHLSLKDVPAYITEENIAAVILTLHKALQAQFSIPNPCIAVCALNPHAGESGHLGREEIDIIIPCLDKLRKTGVNVIGPLAADTVFLPTHLSQYDAVVSMYHDQALPVIKHMDFARTVNITLGLPFIRTSVDHGTALDIAGKGIADVHNFQSALETAMMLTSPI
jgi:4-hydroxythreonine-4-phosphate dehydrogenase